MRLTLFALLFVSLAQAQSLRLGAWEVPMLDGWKAEQKAAEGAVRLLSFSKGTEWLSFYVGNAAPNFDEALVLGKTEWSVADKAWTIAQTQFFAFEEKNPVYVTYFTRVENGMPYWGFSRAETALKSQANALEFLKAGHWVSGYRSLTDSEFTGKKYYLGFGDFLSGSMGNEVKYDIKHTHDMFTSAFGGSYIGTKVHGSSADEKDLTNKWKDLGEEMTWDDMYVQYSSGHGYETGLAFGVTYNDIRNNALSYPAKEIIIFIMACHAGGLVDSFNQKKSSWSYWGDYGRTLFVMASSRTSETSSTGPGTDNDESGGPDGSAGSAYGHALWKSLIGYADGAVDGTKDGFISLGEIEKHTIKLTKQVGGHTPVVTGVYQPSLIMNRVPPKAWRDSLERGTEGLSDEEVTRQIRALDAELRIR